MLSEDADTLFFLFDYGNLGSLPNIGADIQKIDCKKNKNAILVGYGLSAKRKITQDALNSVLVLYQNIFKRTYLRNIDLNTGAGVVGLLDSLQTFVM